MFAPQLKRNERRIAVMKWAEEDEIAEAIHNELALLGCQPTFFSVGSAIPEGSDTVFTFGPYGKMLPLVRQLASTPAADRALLVHWNTEGLPDLRLPWRLTRFLGAGRTWLERVRHRLEQTPGRFSGHALLSLLDSRMLRFRYVGDYHYASDRGILNVLADSSAIYTHLRTRRGLPALFAPWGSVPHWYADLNLERDIDVLWMGSRKSRRRRKIVDRIRNELQKEGVEIYMADNEENPFIFGDERTHILNRAKITLNVTRTWYDDNFSRFSMAAPNRSLIVSETMLPHCPDYRAGVHYVEVEAQALAQTILAYLRRPAARAPIVEQAYQLATSQLTLCNTVKRIMNRVEAVRHGQR